MGEEPTGGNEPSPHPVSLNYAAPAQSSERAIEVVVTIGGAVLALILVGFIGAVLFPYPVPINRVWPPTSSKPAWKLVIGFWSLVPIVLIGFLLLRSQRPWRYFHWFLLGILIGVGVAGLLEGTCYANP